MCARNFSFCFFFEGLKNTHFFNDTRHIFIIKDDNKNNS